MISSSTTIDLLPNEILELIFFELNLKDLGNCSCTCQKWEKIIERQFTDKGIPMSFKIMSLIISTILCST